MRWLSSKKHNLLKKDPSLAEGSFFRARRDSGNVVFYALMAVMLMAMLIFAFARGGRENLTPLLATKIAEELFVQANLIRSAIQQCALEFPGGGGDMAPVGAPDGVIDENDNPNNPYPLKPSAPENANAPAGIAAAGDDNVRHLTCVGAPADQAYFFDGIQNQGRYLPPPPQGFSEWTYNNSSSDGVLIEIVAPNTSEAKAALQLVKTKFGGGLPTVKVTTSTILTIWIVAMP